MENNQFDATLGGAEHLPHSANSLKFATSRSIEIAAMTENIMRPGVTKLIFQTLPVHMRRRVMSHNAKRLPRKLRNGHMDQLKKSGLPPKQKRPSRKYRRRPANLLSEFNRRKQSKRWLETHIWHAKRFHMIERWNHKIPYAPCDKAFRACYRASSAHCLMQDISFYIPVQISGDVENIRKSFRDITNSACNLGVCSKAFLSGSRQGSIHLYRPNLFPFGYVGQINYLWEPCEGSIRKLLLFVHPSLIQQVKLILNKFVGDDCENDDTCTIPKKRIKLSKDTALKIPIEITYLDQTYNIFRLTGPNSHAVLVKSLKCINNIENIKTNKWIASHFAGSPSDLRLKDKSEYWHKLEQVSSPAQLPPKIVLGLVVRDPRLSRPSIRRKACVYSSENIHIDSIVTVPKFASYSPLWNLDIQKSIREKRLTTSEFIKRITETQLIPGEVFENDPEMQSVPVVLIQRTGSQDPSYKRLGYGSGWDVIVPSGYGLPFWQTFIMFGARAGGLRETESLAFEMGESYFCPDSNAGKEEEMRIEKELRGKYFRLPPKKRVNYIKFGVNSPFINPWRVLLNDWSNKNIQEFYVLRDKQLLAKIQESINKITSLPEIDEEDCCLITIYVQLIQKGSLKRHAHICLPKQSDLKLIKTLFEPLHTDDNEEKRKLLRKHHRRSIKQERRKAVRRRLKQVSMQSSQSKKKLNQEPSEYVKKMRELWLPSNIQNVRQHCSRETLGYVSNGSFSFSQAISCGIGYVPYNALKTLLKSRQNCVLVRNTSSRKYRLAKFQIINT